MIPYRAPFRISKYFYTLTVTVLVGFCIFKTDKSIAASTASVSATATMSVLASITLSTTSNLIFPSAAQGDPTATVAASTTENANNASFLVTGQPGSTYTITLPTSITMINGAATIAVTSFTSSPVSTGTLSGGGTQTIFVGATRAALSAAQLAGNYSGTFSVTVNY